MKNIFIALIWSFTTIICTLIVSEVGFYAVDNFIKCGEYDEDITTP